MGKRKVLITSGMSHDTMLIITDAPKEDIENWCRQYNKDLENGESHYFDSLQDNYYVNVLFDSEESEESDDIDVIGYDEVYDLFDYMPEDIDESFNLKKVLKNALVLLVDETYDQYEDHEEWLSMITNELDCPRNELTKLGFRITEDGDIIIK